MPDKLIYPTPQDVEMAFYNAIERADLETLMAVWSEDDEIVCVHPGGARLIGYTAIRAAWQHIFANGPRLKMRLSAITAAVTPLSAVLTAVQHVSVRNEETKRAPLVVTNAFVRGALGWRLVLHHTSPAPPNSEHNVPKILH
jgi:ketosteroid isomerase-like protein